MRDAPATSDARAEVMASVDAAGQTPEFVIADVGRDEAWLSMPERAAPALTDWR